MKISVIVPFYCEEKILPKTLHLVDTFSKKRKEFEFIFVDDGSIDRSKEIVSHFIKTHKNSKIKLISYNINKGKGFAVRKGIQSTDADLALFTDADLAYSLDHLDLLKDALQFSDLVIGSRSLIDNTRELSLSRRILGRGFNILSRILLGLNYLDMQAGLKGFKKDAARKIFARQKIDGFAFDVELIFLAKKNHLSIGQIPAKITNPESYKDSKVKLFKDSLKMFYSLVKIRMYSLTRKYD